MNTNDMIAVLQAHKRGEPVEYYDDQTSSWRIVVDPAWNFSEYKYRAWPKTEPASLETMYRIDLRESLQTTLGQKEEK